MTAAAVGCGDILLDRTGTCAEQRRAKPGELSQKIRRGGMAREMLRLEMERRPSKNYFGHRPRVNCCRIATARSASLQAREQRIRVARRAGVGGFSMRDSMP
jgi:hypothetical protein